MADETSVGKDMGFLSSMIGIFKIVSWVLSLLILIVLSITQYWAYAGLGAVAFANFTASFVCITLLISVFIYFFKLYNVPLVKRLPWRKLEIAYAALCSVFYFISMCILAWAAEHTKDAQEKFSGNFTAGAVFSAVQFVLFGVFAILTFRNEEIRSEPTATGGNNVDI